MLRTAHLYNHPKCRSTFNQLLSPNQLQSLNHLGFATGSQALYFGLTVEYGL